MNEYAFLLAAFSLAYPLISDLFWFGWNAGTIVETLCCSTYICLGLTLRSLPLRLRWFARSVLWLTVMIVTPRAVFPMPRELESARIWWLRAMLACCVYLLVSTGRGIARERPRIA